MNFSNTVLDHDISYRFQNIAEELLSSVELFTVDIFCCNVTEYKTLFSQASLGIDNYVVVREKTAQQFANTQDRFKTKMKEFSEADGASMIFTEDLKSIIHLADSNDDDLTLVKAMIRK